MTDILNMPKPRGGIEAYDLLNSSVAPQDENEITAETLDVSSKCCWGLLRCRMAVIIKRRAHCMGWLTDYERRAILFCKYWLPQTIKGGGGET